MTRNDIVVKRNGLSEPIYSIEKEDGMYEVCTGTEEYILGKQVFTFEYEYQNVITVFVQKGTRVSNIGAGTKYTVRSENAKENSVWQELYWDTNGTGFKQSFESLTANLHFEHPENWTGDAWCYVGVEGSTNQSRCQITKNDDGVTFRTGRLSGGENLTFDVELKAGSFILPPPEESRTMIYLAVVIIGAMALITFFSVRAFNKAAPNRKHYKNTLVKPEYEPLENYDMHTLAEDFIGTHSNPSVATIIKMVTDGRIKLIKGEKKILGGYKWEIFIKSTDNIQRNEEIILKILNGGGAVYAGQTIKLKRYYGNSRLESLGRELEKYGRVHGHSKGLLVDDKIHTSSAVISTIMITICCIFLPIILALGSVEEKIEDVIMEVVDGGASNSESVEGGSERYYDGKLLVNYHECAVAIVVTVVLGVIINIFLRSNSGKYSKRTQKGLEVSRYMEGLKLYIKMAEAERLSFLQSVPGADVSPEGIVKLYEKLLPYAVFFGLEKTWLKEMNAFCELNHITTEAMNLNISDVALMSSFIRTIPTSTNFSSSGSSGGSSSSHSGGGGGGFSGGGGGGGGGGFR